MKQTLHYLKPYILSLIAIAFLVIGQVEAELALPSYMANMITDGIQYGGIDEETPILITGDTYNTMSYFVDEDILSSSYTKQPIGTNLSMYDQTFKTLVPTYHLIKDSDTINQAFLYTTFIKSEALQKKLDLKIDPSSLDHLSSDELNDLTNQLNIELKTFTQANQSAALRMGMKQQFKEAGMNMQVIQDAYLKQTGIKMLAYTALSTTCAVLIALLAARVASNVAASIRMDVFKRVEEFELADFSKFSTASLITRTTNDVQQIQQVISTLLRIGLFAPFLGIAALLKVIHYRSMAGILGVAIVIIASLLAFTFKYNIPRYKKIQKLVDRLNLVSREQLSGLLVIRAFNNQKVEEKRFDDVNSDITKLNIEVNRMIAYTQPFIMFIMSFMGVLIVYFGARQIDLGTLQVGDMMAFIQYSMNVIFSFLVVAMVLTMIPRSSISAKRVFEVINTELTIIDPSNPVPFTKEPSTITFDHVSFKYPHAQDDVLHDISFKAKRGETIAVIGSTGCGKSTLVNLLPRFFDATSGNVYLDDVNIKNLSLISLRSMIGYIPQKGILFNDTIENNLRYANKDATLDELNNALRIAQATDFVSEMSDGIEHEISQDATNVSGGQKQRLSIARAISRKANIYIFDDTFSALDFKTAASLKQELSKMQEERGATVFIVAQRISTIMNADQILVLENGELVGHGTHEELLQSCKIYQEIALSQLSREELAHE